MHGHMPPRQPHKKSRKGCLSCKKRHLKCDEQGPPCTNCRVRKLGCNYGGIATPLSLSHQEQTPDPILFASSNTRRSELELFHQWATDTYSSFVFRSTDEDLWQVTIPRSALDQDYLLNAILAITSLHMSTTATSPHSRRHQLLALEYHNLAITAIQSEERHTTFQSHQSLFAYSIINLVFVVALPSRLDRDLDQPSIVGNLSTMFPLLQGTTHIHTLSKSWLSEGPFGHFIRSNSSMQIEDLGPTTQAAFAGLRSLRDEEHTALATSKSSAMDAVRTQILFSTAIDNLEVCFQIRDKDRMVVCFRWLALLEEEFVRRVEKLEPFALLITMYWAILLDRLGEKKWWAKSAGKALVAEISRLVVPYRPLWVSVMSWVNPGGGTS